MFRYNFQKYRDKVIGWFLDFFIGFVFYIEVFVRGWVFFSYQYRVVCVYCFFSKMSDGNIILFLYICNNMI